MTTIEKKELEKRIMQLENENEIMKKLSTRKGFYNTFFDNLKTATSNKEAFNEVNEQYHTLFGAYRYSDFNTFKRMSNYYNNA